MNNGEEFNPKFELTFLDKKLKQAFKNVNKDVNQFRGEFSGFQKFVTKEFGKLLLADERVAVLFNFNKDFVNLQRKVGDMTTLLKTSASEKEVKNKFENVTKKLAETVDKKEYNEKIKQIDDILSSRHVRKIDLAKVESQVNNLKKELEALGSAGKSFNVLKEDFIDFKKKALTKYNFDKFEKWIKEIEKDVLVLVALKKKVDMLASIKEVDDMRRGFNKNTGEFIKLKKDVQNVLPLRNEFKALLQNNKEQFSGYSKGLKDMDSDLTSVEKDLDKLERRISHLEKVEKKSKAKTVTKGKKKAKKKCSQNVFRQVLDWLLEDVE
ncbi:MAG: hypothetical protein KAT43_00380 [Nanoarchaeota archaeon]|nr:hypothetical protein [Nanoarchaeota archaeon]